MSKLESVHLGGSSSHHFIQHKEETVLVDVAVFEALVHVDPVGFAPVGFVGVVDEIVGRCHTDEFCFGCLLFCFLL